MHNSLTDFDFLPNTAHVRLPVVAALFACSYSTIWRGVRAGRLPKPLKLFDRTSAWNVGELRRALKVGHLARVSSGRGCP